MPATALSVAVGAGFGEGVANANAQAVDQPNDNKFTNDGKTILVVRNGSGGNLTVTLKLSAGPYTANAAVNKAATVGNGNIALFGPFPSALYGGEVTVGWSTGTSVTAAPVTLGSTPI